MSLLNSMKGYLIQIYKNQALKDENHCITRLINFSLQSLL